jgi:hypothetical protein
VMEVLPFVDGLDLETSLEGDLKRRGRLLGPRQETVFGSRVDEAGREELLRFRATGGPMALHRTSATGVVGSVFVAVFHGRGDDSFDDLPARERLRPSAIGGLQTFPQRRYAPMRLPYQYR